MNFEVPIEIRSYINKRKEKKRKKKPTVRWKIYSSGLRREILCFVMAVYLPFIETLQKKIEAVRAEWATAAPVPANKKGTASAKTETDLTAIKVAFDQLQKELNKKIEEVSKDKLQSSLGSGEISDPTATALALSVVQTSVQLLQKIHSVHQLLLQYIRIKGNPNEFETPFLLDTMQELRQAFLQSETVLPWSASKTSTAVPASSVVPGKIGHVDIPVQFEPVANTMPPCHLTVPQMQELINCSIDSVVAESMADEKNIFLPRKKTSPAGRQVPSEETASDTCGVQLKPTANEKDQKKEVSFNSKEKQHLLKQLFVHLFLQRTSPKSKTCQKGIRNTCNASRKEQVMAEIQSHKNQIANIESVVQNVPGALDTCSNPLEVSKNHSNEDSTIPTAVKYISQFEKEVRKQMDVDYDTLFTQMQKVMWTDSTNEVWNSEALLDLQKKWETQLDPDTPSKISFEQDDCKSIETFVNDLL